VRACRSEPSLAAKPFDLPILSASAAAARPLTLEEQGSPYAHHTEGETSQDSSIGACWDSDRLNLWRVGHEPDPRYLSTATARRPERIAWALELQSKE
jgi:hypothetical protein